MAAGAPTPESAPEVAPRHQLCRRRHDLRERTRGLYYKLMGSRSHRPAATHRATPAGWTVPRVRRVCQQPAYRALLRHRHWRRYAPSHTTDHFIRLFLLSQRPCRLQRSWHARGWHSHERRHGRVPRSSPCDTLDQGARLLWHGQHHGRAGGPLVGESQFSEPRRHQPEHRYQGHQ